MKINGFLGLGVKKTECQMSYRGSAQGKTDIIATKCVCLVSIKCHLSNSVGMLSVGSVVVYIKSIIASDYAPTLS